MICIGGVPVLKRHLGGAGLGIFYMIRRGGRIYIHIRLGYQLLSSLHLFVQITPEGHYALHAETRPST